METEGITCPTCFEVFHFPLPQCDEVPCELDYDCEVCCRPMVVSCGLDEAGNAIVTAVDSID